MSTDARASSADGSETAAGSPSRLSLASCLATAPAAVHPPAPVHPPLTSWETLPQSESWIEAARRGGERTGSVRSSVLNLTNTIIGAGMLGLPAAFAACGWAVGSLLLLACGLFSGLGLHLLSAAADLVGRPASFRSVAEAALPGSGLPYAIDAAIAVKCFGVATSYLVVVGDSMPKAIEPLGATGLLLDRRLWVAAAVPILAPLVSLRRIDALKYASLLALGCLLLVTVEIAAFSSGPVLRASPLLNPYPNSTRDCFPPNGDLPCRGAVSAATSALDAVRKVPIFVFSFTCQQNIVSITNELRRPSQRRVAAAVALSETVAVGQYLLVGFCGYLTFGDRIAGDVLASYPASPIVSFARVLMALSVVLSYGLQSHPSRSCLLSLLSVARAARDARRRKIEPRSFEV